MNKKDFAWFLETKHHRILHLIETISVAPNAVF